MPKEPFCSCPCTSGGSARLCTQSQQGIQCHSFYIAAKRQNQWLRSKHSRLERRKRQNRAAGHTKERILVDTAREFQANGTPLCLDSLQNLAIALIQSFPQERCHALDFKDGRPGKRWIQLLLKRFPELSIKTRVNLEHGRAEAMTLEIFATHFAHVRALCDK